MKAALMVVCAAALAGCNTVERVAERHTEANQVQAEATNQQLLLNIVRAQRREALHFSRIPEIVLPLASPTLGTLAIPFGNGTDKEYTLGGQAGMAALAARVIPQDSQEFMQGVSQPVSAGLLGFYLDQGWPPRLVLALFVDQIVVTAGGRKWFLDDYPESRNVAWFYAMLDMMAELRPVVSAPLPTPGTAFGPTLHAASAETQLAGLAALRSAGLFARSVGDRLEVVVPGSTRELHFRDGACRQALDTAPPSKRPDSQPLPPALLQALQGGQAVIGSSEKPAAIELTLRSPLSMIYHLGERLRGAGRVDAAMGFEPLNCEPGGQLTRAEQPTARHRAQLWPMQAAVSPEGGAPCTTPSSGALRADDTYVAVVHRGCRYAIGLGTEVDRSAQAMSLVGELLQLQYKGLAAPTTVRLQSP